MKHQRDMIQSLEMALETVAFAMEVPLQWVLVPRNGGFGAI